MEELHACADRRHVNSWCNLFSGLNRRVHLKEVRLNPNPGATLPLVAVFVGEDATPHWTSPLEPNLHSPYTHGRINPRYVNRGTSGGVD
jgi:hypothetical protein